MSDIDRMTDEELVLTLAQFVCNADVCGLYGDDAGKWFTGDGDLWQPLADWNHTMHVVAAMRVKGWRFIMEYHGLREGHFAVTVQFYMQDQPKRQAQQIGVDDEKRTILRAALTASRSKP